MKLRLAVLPILAIVMGAGAMMSAAGAMADPKVVLQEKGCLVCHAFDRRKVGPAYDDVEKRYKGRPDAARKLAEKVAGGKMGHPKTSASLAEAKEAIDYILDRPVHER